MIRRDLRGQSISLTEQERQSLEELASAQGMSPCLARRAQLILLAAQGHSNLEICDLCGCSQQTVTVWRRRWQAGGLASLSRRRTRCGRPARPSTELDWLRRADPSFSAGG